MEKKRIWLMLGRLRRKEMSMGESEAVTFLCDSAFSRLLFGGRIGNAANAQVGLAAGIGAATEGGLDISDCNYS